MTARPLRGDANECAKAARPLRGRMGLDWMIMAGYWPANLYVRSAYCHPDADPWSDDRVRSRIRGCI